MKAVHFLLDETGSMSALKNGTIRDYNDYLDGLEGHDLVFALTKFDTTKVELVHGLLPVENALRLTEENYQPGAMTPLYDAMAHVIKQTERMVQDLEKKHGHRVDVLITVLTDGAENASREYDMDKLNAMIADHENAWGWSFMYLGVAPDAWKNEQAFVGTQMAQTTTQTVGASGLSASMDVARGQTVSWASAPTGTKAKITEDQKKWAKEQSEQQKP